MLGSLLKEINLVAKYPLNVDNTIKTYLINLNIILYYSSALNTCECFYVRFINSIIIDWKVIHISF